jgi:hypothetical protein
VRFDASGAGAVPAHIATIPGRQVRVETTVVTQGMLVRTADLERICERRDPRAVEYACFLLHSSKGDAALAAFRAIEGMFDDPAVRATQRETAECVREVALAAYDLQLARRIEEAIEKCWPPPAES